MKARYAELGRRNFVISMLLWDAMIAGKFRIMKFPLLLFRHKPLQIRMGGMVLGVGDTLYDQQHRGKRDLLCHMCSIALSLV